jgi:hypothetical protein
VTHNPLPHDEAFALEARLDALGRAMTAESQLVPIEFLGAVRHRRQAIAFKRFGTACAAALALFVVVFLARYEFTHTPAAGPSTLERPTTPTYANLRAVGDVNALPKPTGGSSTPAPRAAERTDTPAAKALTEFK